MRRAGSVEPGVRRAETGRPHDRADRAEVELERGGRPTRVGSGRSAAPELAVEAVLGGVLVDAVEQALLLQVGRRAHVGERPGELRSVAVATDEPSDELDALGGDAR